MIWQRLGGVMAWTLVVVVGAAGSWYAIDQAGGAVTPDTTTLSLGDPAPSGDGGPSVSRAPGTSSSTPTSRPTSGQTARPTPKPTGRPTPGPTARPSATGSGSAAARPQRRTWTGAPGVVVASCTGTVLRFESAQPADGWRVEREDDGDVDVTFERGEQEVRVRATCSNGRPEFEVRSEG